LEKFRKLAEKNPEAYLPYVASTLMKFSIFYRQSIKDKEKSIQYALENMWICLPYLKKIPKFQNYSNRGMQIIQKWGEDPEKLLQDFISRKGNNQEEF
jgi:vesicle coat complex subunit